MSPIEKGIHRLVISLCFSVLTWLIVDHFIVDLPLWKYFIIELLLVISWKFSIFTTRKLNL